MGASLGGTMRGAHQGFDCRASCWITPPNAGSGAGSCLPSIVVVALGEPRTPVIWGVPAEAPSAAPAAGSAAAAAMATSTAQALRQLSD